MRRHGASPLDYLRSLIAPDGHVRYSRGTDQTPVWVTAQALMALEAQAAAALAGPADSPRPGAAGAAGEDRDSSGSHHASAGASSGASSGTAAGEQPAVPRAAPERAAAPDPALDRLAGYAGVLTALTLATVGAS